MPDTRRRVTDQNAFPIPAGAELRTVVAPRGYEPLYRNTFEQLQWTTASTVTAPFGSTRLLLQRPAKTRPAADALFERRAERALARIAALEQHPARTALALHLIGSAIAFSMLTISILSATAGEPTLTPILVGAVAWIPTAVTAPLVRAWRTRRVQHRLHAEYRALRTCTPQQNNAARTQSDRRPHPVSLHADPALPADARTRVVLQSQ